MKVIKAENVSKQIRCKHCGSLLEYVPQDIKTYYPSIDIVDMYGDEAIPMDYIGCPVCCKTIWLLWKGDI